MTRRGHGGTLDRGTSDFLLAAIPVHKPVERSGVKPGGCPGRVPSASQLSQPLRSWQRTSVAPRGPGP
jgi:hypothetical protein